MLRLANLEVVYHSVVRVLRGVSLELPEGSIIALLGPNGAGKTTTLRAITGLLDIHEGRVTKGTVELAGVNLVGLNAEAIVGRGIAQVMEGRRILAELTVEEIREDIAAERDAKVPLLNKMGTGWDVAHAAVFLASDEAGFITGIELPVDGGSLARVG